MKAIIKVSKGSFLAPLNGQTFPVISKGASFTSLDINGTTTDFNNKEIEIIKA
jgi:hypothetical protein